MIINIEKVVFLFRFLAFDRSDVYSQVFSTVIFWVTLQIIRLKVLARGIKSYGRSNATIH